MLKISRRENNASLFCFVVGKRSEECIVCSQGFIPGLVLSLFQRAAGLYYHGMPMALRDGTRCSGKKISYLYPRYECID